MTYACFMTYVEENICMANQILSYRRIHDQIRGTCPAKLAAGARIRPWPPSLRLGARMFSRWRVPLAAITLMSGSLLVRAPGTASAATASQPGPTQVRPGGAVAGFQPGGPIKNRTGPSPQGKGGSNDAESTNWSGYAVTGGTGA